jgi:hypothetical protein
VSTTLMPSAIEPVPSISFCSPWPMPKASATTRSPPCVGACPCRRPPCARPVKNSSSASSWPTGARSTKS